MSTQTPQFLITDQGLAVASVATPTGPFINIVGFQVGDGFGYTPQPTDPGINGNLLYAGVPVSYSYVGDGTINIVCRIPPDAGPFNFGEVALMLPGNVMFAKAVFATPQTKYSSLGTNVASTYTFNCLLKLQQSVAVLQINTEGPPPAVWEVDKWSDVYPPALSANPGILMIIVNELSPGLSDGTLLTQSTVNQWAVASNYKFVFTGTVANGSLNYVECPASQFPVTILSTTSRLNVIRFADGYFRSVASVVVSGANYRFNLNPDPLLNPPTVNSTIEIFSVSAFNTPYVQQGTGVGQTNNTVKVGWSTAGKLRLTVDSTDFGFTWPMSVQGTAGTLGQSGNPGVPMTFNWSGQGGQPTWLWGGNDGINMYVYNPSNFSVAFATNATHANHADDAISAVNSLFAGNAANGGVTSVNGMTGAVTVSAGVGTAWSQVDNVVTTTYNTTNDQSRSIFYSSTVAGSGTGRVANRLYVNGALISDAQNYHTNDPKTIQGVVFVPAGGSLTVDTSTSGGSGPGRVLLLRFL